MKKLFLFLNFFYYLLFNFNEVKAQGTFCPCQQITSNISFNNTHDLECAIMKRVNCLLAQNLKCYKEVKVSRPSDGLVIFQDTINGTTHPFSQNLYNAFIGGIFNGNCGSSANPITPSIIQTIANVIYNRIISQSSIYLPNKIARIRNFTINYVGLCNCSNYACAYEFLWEIDIVKCGNVDIPNKN